jgi:hypothetical protein
MFGHRGSEGTDMDVGTKQFGYARTHRHRESHHYGHIIRVWYGGVNTVSNVNNFGMSA